MLGGNAIPGVPDVAAMEYVEDDGGLPTDAVVGVSGLNVAMDVDAEGSGVSTRREDLSADASGRQEGTWVGLVEMVELAVEDLSHIEGMVPFEGDEGEGDEVEESLGEFVSVESVDAVERNTRSKSRSARSRG